MANVWFIYRQESEIINREEFVALAGRVVSESSKLKEKGYEVAKVCTEEKLAKVRIIDTV